MKKVIVFGTFDLVHKGHLSFFRQAKRLGDCLMAVVARDKFVKGAKGKFPTNNEKSRLRNVRKLDLVDKAILGSRTHNFFRTIRTHKADIIALGHDQKPPVKNLKRDLRRHRLGNIKIVRLKPYKANQYKTSKLTVNKERLK
ncbi:MAG TPA: adenylyltransferase/cytidyltransferase family protein [Candidatus Nanoarchaeia archaeon]